MEHYEQRFDDYIAQSADFARPVLTHLRELVHQAEPRINEIIKWSMPHFDYKGPVCHMAAFKEHCGFGFWKGSMLTDPQNLLKVNAAEAMGQFGRITSVASLPADDVIIAYIKEAVLLNQRGVKSPAKKMEKARPELLIPDDLIVTLQANPIAIANFDNFSNSHKKEYAEWIAGAKTETTRLKRLETALQWITEGKSRHWKYK